MWISSQPFVWLHAMHHFKLIFINFVEIVVRELDLSYQILKGEGCGLLTDKDLIEAAKWLENQELVRCVQAGEGIAVQFDLVGIDAWIRAKLDELQVDWRLIQPGIYGIAASNEVPKQLVEEGRSVFQFSYRSLWIKSFATDIPCLPNDTVVLFADVFCQKKPIADVVQQIARRGQISFCLDFRKAGVFLDEIKIVSNKSVVRKSLILILAEHQASVPQGSCVPFLSFEELAERLYEKYGIYVESIKTQVYKPLHDLQMKAFKQNPKIGQQGLIEIKKGICRLQPYIFCAGV
jgi:hypothetical protein